MLNFTYEYNDNTFSIDITSFSCNLPEDIEYDIYRIFDNGNKKLLHESPLYSFDEIADLAIEHALHYYYDKN